jgi:lipid II:glycine glycyltransferase (peptidoglycan interpeptide bridge formation enzyme)
MKSLGWEVVKLEKSYLYIKKLPLKISIAKLQRPEKMVDMSKLQGLIKKHRIIFLLVELKDIKQYRNFKSKGFKLTQNPSLPTKTIQFNLLKSEKKLLNGMHHKARYNIRLSKRRGITVKESDDIKAFSEFWQECSKSWGMRFSQRKEITSLHKAFGNNAVVLDAHYKKELIASVFLVSTKDTTYYMYAASSIEGNKLHAPSLLVWESIKYSKKRGKKVFDFGGIYDERFPLERGKGFSEFKRKFGGEVVEYPGPLKKLFLPL